MGFLRLFFTKSSFRLHQSKEWPHLTEFRGKHVNIAQSENAITREGLPGSARTGAPNPARGAGGAALSASSVTGRGNSSLSLALNCIYRGSFQWNHGLLLSLPVKPFITATNTKSEIRIKFPYLRSDSDCVNLNTSRRLVDFEGNSLSFWWFKTSSKSKFRQIDFELRTSWLMMSDRPCLNVTNTW